MKRALLILLVLVSASTFAQTGKTTGKYQSLLWQISGNGLVKPSYLFGTMHVSSKMAFHLADSFYLGIRNADVVALETNPESWQEDMVNYNLQDGDGSGNMFSAMFVDRPREYLRRSTLQYFPYERRIENALVSNPASINNLLYRTYGNDASDFEEDTYLDMYIYQCGKKWGKQVAGVERYAESMRLMKEAYADAANDKSRKQRNYDVDEDYSEDKLQEAYRNGNLDRLDSINRLNSFSEVFDEKFLYRRNEIQAASIDSILKTKHSLFVGVGAAHLPGKRGVIELLRAKGYTLRPVLMGERDSRQKDEVEKIRVPVTFKTDTAEDHFYTVEVPGKLYNLEEDNSYQRQYADMANGSFYMVTRVLTSAWMWGKGQKDVMQQIDSLLYENIPGKMISKKAISRNGYPGFDITSRTRRGDLQRYNIFVTPFEVLVFKMSGNGDYVGGGDEADRFFSSIQLEDYNSANSWQPYTPAFGGFTVQLPHQPYIGNDGSWLFDAEDSAGKTQYRIIRSDIHNYSFAEEDTFDLALLDESFAASEFIDRQVSRKLTNFKGYPALDCQYKDKKGQLFQVRFIIQGPHYYALVAHGKKETTQTKQFFNSFNLVPFIYPVATLHTDTLLHFSVKSPVFPAAAKEDLPNGARRYLDDDQVELFNLYRNMSRSMLLSNDSTGEKVYISYYRVPRYFYTKDSSLLQRAMGNPGSSKWIVKQDDTVKNADGFEVRNMAVTDTNSSRLIQAISFYKNGQQWEIVSLSDTLTPPSDFVRNVFASFQPQDSAGTNPFVSKANLFFDDLASTDSSIHKRALLGSLMVNLENEDLPRLKQAISSLSWSEKNYLKLKEGLVAKMGTMSDSTASDYLKSIYYAAGDTVELQYTALTTLLAQQTRYSYGVFRDIVTVDPPVLTAGDSDFNPYLSILQFSQRNRGLSMGGTTFMAGLSDSLPLTRTILPDILPLINVDDYKKPVMQLLAQMVDSSLVKASDYESYFTKFLLEARQEMKKQLIQEKTAAIRQAEKGKKDEEDDNNYMNRILMDGINNGTGNADLELYSKLLLPFWETRPGVHTLFDQLLASNDKQLRYNTAILLLEGEKPVPDSVLKGYADNDLFRYQLYRDLRGMKHLNRFPVAFNNPQDLGRSELKSLSRYTKIDTVAFVDKRAVEFKNKKGFIYFFKYKSRKDDMSWKLATVGMVPADGKEFEYQLPEAEVTETTYPPLSSLQSNPASVFDFTALTDTKLDEAEPLADQITKLLKKTLYAKHKSAARFYDDRSYSNVETVSFD